MKLLLMTGFCELTTCTGKLCRDWRCGSARGLCSAGHSANTTPAAREALGALLKRRICLSNLIQEIPGLWAEVKLSWNQTLRDYVWAGAIGAESGGGAGGQVQEATVVPTSSSQLPAGPRGFSSLPWQPEDGWGRAGAREGLWYRQTDRWTAVRCGLSLAVSARTGRITEQGEHPTPLKHNRVLENPVFPAALRSGNLIL